ncbi:MAG: cytochrome c3 family protein, partial [Gallionella sp.]|nr:cytochrome c3 family protein [Gallionella sp.]
VMGSLLAVALMVFSLQAVAETQLGGRDFNHMTTGFPLSGGHAAAACETCHVGGVFKGTPRNCDGCHATGKRIVATPKSNAHIVTDAPCESCHFNTATWLGARFNHGTAKPGQCATCHNGRIVAGKPASHSANPRKAADSCDKCHRTSAWNPASWNHTDAVSDCSVCHNGATAVGMSAGHLTLSMPPVNFVGSCKSCHTSYLNFYSHYYNHANAPITCNTCHGNLNGTGGYAGVRKPTATIHTAVPVQTLSCNACHKSFGAWTGKFDHIGATACATCHSGTYAAFGIRGKSTSHIPYNGTPECSTCHGTNSWATTQRGTTLHTTYLSGMSCFTCHGSNTAYPGNGQETARWPNFHESSKNPSAADCSASSCHRPVGSKGASYTKWD